MVAEGHKQTEIGVIPEDWKVFKIIDITEKILDYRGVTPKKKGLEWGNGNILALSAGNVKKGYIDFNAECYYGSEKLYDKWMTNGDVRKNDIVFTMEAPLGNVALIPDNRKYILSQRTILLQLVTECFESKYVYQIFLSDKFQSYIKNNATGSTAKGIKRKIFEQLLVPVPPIQEQKAIAEALSDVDALIASLESLIEKKEAIKAATMQQLLTGKERLPGFSGEWEERKLGEIGKVVMGHSPSSSNYNFNGIGLPLVQGNADIRNRKTIIRKYTSQITRKASKNDVIMSVRAPVGEIARATFDVCIGRGVCAIKIKNDFLYHYLIFLEPKWSTISTGSTFDSVTSDEVNSLLIYLPSDENEQRAIAQILSDMDKEIELLKTKLEKIKEIKTGMMQELLTGRVRLVGEKE